ncbi:MAG: hypothetical protein ACRCX2_02985 [Paraclostridium sp.]
MALHTQLDNMSNQFIWDEAVRKIFINFDDSIIYDPETGILSVRPGVIINNLTSNRVDASLSANMGRVLNETKLNTYDFNVHKNDTAVHMSIAEKERLTNSVQYNEIVDNATSTSASRPGSANQIRILSNRIQYLETNPTPIIDNLTSTDTNKALSANMGRVLNNNKVENTTFNTHLSDVSTHVTSAERTKWNSALYPTDVVDNLTSTDASKPLSAYQGKILNDKIPDLATMNGHITDTSIHVSDSEKGEWDSKVSMAQLEEHSEDELVHVSEEDRRKWNSKIDGLDLTSHINDTTKHITPALQEKINNALQKSDVLNVLTSYTTNIPLSANMGRVLVGMIPDKNATDSHIASTILHITTAERNKWNSALQRTDVINTLTSTSGDLPLSAAMGKKLQDEKTALTTFNSHDGDGVRHITSSERSNWNDCIRSSVFNSHVNDGVKHITSAERSTWNDRVLNSTFNTHNTDSTRHITTSERNLWNSALQRGNVVNNVSSGNTDLPLSAAMGKHLQDTKAPIANPSFSGTVSTSNYIRMGGTRYVHCDGGASIGFLSSAGGWIFRVDNNGNCYPTGVMHNAVYNDYAEYYHSTIEFEPGDIMMLGDTSNDYVKAVEHSTSVIGVVSDSYGFILGGSEDNNDDMAPIGLKGKLSVKVTGNVKNGDFIVPSNIPGVGRAYTDTDSTLSIVGLVIDSTLKDGKVLIHIK